MMAKMVFGDLVGLKLPDICLTGEEKLRKNLTQETCPDRGSNPGPLREVIVTLNSTVVQSVRKLPLETSRALGVCKLMGISEHLV